MFVLDTYVSETPTHVHPMTPTHVPVNHVLQVKLKRLIIVSRENFAL